MLYKGLKGAASIPTNDLVPPSGIPGIITPWHSKSQWLGLIFLHVQFLLPDYKRLEPFDIIIIIIGFLINVQV